MQSPEEKKEKARWYRIKRTYGLTQEQYNDLDTGSCRICLRPWSKHSPVVKPCVDHDHKSGHVRGIVCTYCNFRVIGRHNDAALIQRLADYLLGPFVGHIVPPKPKRRRKRKK